MVKKSVKDVAKNKIVKKIPVIKEKKFVTKTIEPSRAEKLLFENNVGLQKVVVILSQKVDALTSQMSHLLNLFEKTAETIAKGDLEKESKTEQELLKKINVIESQGKLIARGVALIHGEIENPETPHTHVYPQSRPVMQNAPTPFQRTAGTMQPKPLIQAPASTQPIKQAISGEPMSPPQPTIQAQPMAQAPAEQPPQANDQYQQSITQINSQKEEAPMITEERELEPRYPIPTRTGQNPSLMGAPQPPAELQGVPQAPQNQEQNVNNLP